MTYILQKFKELIKLDAFSRRWRKKNKDNQTTVDSVFDIARVTVGKYSYGVIRPLIYGKKGNLSIGAYCSIGPNVIFIPSSDHELSYISSYPFKVKMLDYPAEAISKGDINVSDDVWIGANSVILSGVNIGQGAVVGCNAIVTKDVPPYAIVAGNPAKIIRYRFSKNVIEKLSKLDFSELNDVSNKISLLYSKIDEDNVDFIIESLRK